MQVHLSFWITEVLSIADAFCFLMEGSQRCFYSVIFFYFFIRFSKLQRTIVLKSWDHTSQNNFFPQLFQFNFAQDIWPCSRIQWAEFDQGIKLRYAMVPNSQQEGGSTTKHAETCFSFDHDTTGMITPMPQFCWSSATPRHSCVSGHHSKA